MLVAMSIRLMIGPEARIPLSAMPASRAFITFTIVADDPDPAECTDTRETVIIGDIDSGVANVDTGDGCTINDLIDEDGDYGSRGEFVRHVGMISGELADAGIIARSDVGPIVSADARSGIGEA